MNMSDRVVEGVGEADAHKTEYRVTQAILPTVVRAVDVCAILITGIVSVGLLPGFADEGRSHHIAAVSFIALFYVGFADRDRLFDTDAIMRPLSRMDDMLVSLTASIALFGIIAFALDVARSFPVLGSTIFGLAAFATMAASRFALRALLSRMSHAQIVGRSLVVLGTGLQSRRFLRRLEEVQPHFTTLVGVFDVEFPSDPLTVEGHRVLGGIEDLLAHARDRKIDDVVVALPWNADDRVTAVIERLKELPINVYLSSDLVGYDLTFQPAPGDFSTLPVFEVVQRPISGWSSAFKAIEDYILATFALILVSPLLTIIAIAIKLDSSGPVFFMQKRLGFNNKPFYIYKFRSMYYSSVPPVFKQATKDDPRVTRVGRFIRATSLDELPQLLNVLNGTMSLVGPRPHPISLNEEFGDQVRGYFARHRVKPGITGWAQVNGYRGETPELSVMEARVRHDIYYADNWSLIFDMRILFMTVLTVLFHKNAY